MTTQNGSNPFHTIVLTSPDAQAAKAAEDQGGPLHQQNLPSKIVNPDESKIHIISTSDPFNTRMGSGGGTLAAIHEADLDRQKRMYEGEDVGTQKGGGSVLIIHAGGQSSRCPTQMTLGKAWTDLPILNKNQSGAELDDVLTNPTYILMESLSKLLKNIPDGSVVIAASDVIIHLPADEHSNGDVDASLSFDGVEDDKILGLAVPAPLHTAKNHGVFSLDGQTIRESGKSAKIGIQAVDKFFQKPTVESMKAYPGCTFPSQRDNSSENDTADMAWIDTGVVVFLPKAANCLRQLIDGDLSHYTASGLSRLYRSQAEVKNAVDNESLEAFAKVTITSKLELSSHLLLAASTRREMQNTDRKELLQNYLSNESNGGFCPRLLRSIFDHLSHFELQVCTVPRGQFIHLGTTVELLQFLISGTRSCSKGSVIGDENVSGLQLTSRSNASLFEVEADRECIVMNSVVDSALSLHGPSSVGKQSVVEHCFLKSTTLKVGSTCIISGLRGRCDSIIDIPSDMILQMLPVDRVHDDSDRKGKDSQYVFMYLGIRDEIKKHETCYGVSFDKIFSEVGLQPNELWEENDPKQLLWNAKIHPIMISSNDGMVDWEPFVWIRHYLAEGVDAITSPLVQSSLQKWKALPKLSLAQIQRRVDACSEFLYRSQLKDSRNLLQTVECFKHMVLNRQHEEIKCNAALNPISLCHNNFVGYSLYFEPLFEMFKGVIVSSLAEGNYDICSRCLMILSSACAERANQMTPIRSTSLDDSSDFIFSYLDSIKSLSADIAPGCEPMLDFLQNMIKSAIESSDVTLLENCSVQLEDAAFAFIARCVTSSIPKAEFNRNIMPPCGSWVVSNAPARIDLSGGWSDTPPVSYEFGGAVCNLAVTLRNTKPLSARCRKVKGLKGIILKVENRDIDSGKLLEFDSIHIKMIRDISDFRDPRATCALLKCAVVALGVIDLSLINEQNEQSVCKILDHIFGNDTLDESFGLELISTSLLPHGSGLGTSSILAGCVICSLGQCLGLSKVNDPSFMIKTILNLEQLLSTGGGWQDQVGGLYPGLKLCTAEMNVIPIQVHVETHEISAEQIQKLNDRLLLAFSGQPRLAKNILQKVLRQWARRSPEIVSTVNSLVEGAHEAINAIKDHDLNRLGNLMNSYWMQKKFMAGEDSGVEPEAIKELFAALADNNITSGATLAGAGGGGFLALLLQEGRLAEEAMKIVDLDDKITWYRCQVCSEGLRSFVNSSDDTDFQLHWHFVES